MKKTRIFILTQKDPFFVPKIINFLKKRSLNENFVIAGITALSPSRKNKTIIDWLSERLEMYNLRELFLVFTSLFYVWIVKRFGNFNQRKKFSLEDICYPNIPIIETDNINDPRYLSILEKYEIDIITSISCPQIFGKKLIELPKLACINAHGTLLPKHRGVHGSWWTLFSGDERGGSTVHLIDPQIDSGDILLQCSFQKNNKDTQYSIAFKTKILFSRLLLLAIKQISQSTSKYSKMNVKNGNYNYAPKYKDQKEFRERKYRIITIKDFFGVIMRPF